MLHLVINRVTRPSRLSSQKINKYDEYARALCHPRAQLCRFRPSEYVFQSEGFHCPMPGLVHGELLAPVSLNSMIG